MIGLDSGTIGDRMRAARIEADISQEEAARRLGVGARTYTRWERGETTTVSFLQYLDEIAEALETTPDVILGTTAQITPTDRLILDLQAKVDRLTQMVEGTKSRKSK